MANEGTKVAGELAGLLGADWSPERVGLALLSLVRQAGDVGPAPIVARHQDPSLPTVGWLGPDALLYRMRVRAVPLPCGSATLEFSRRGQPWQEAARHEWDRLLVEAGWTRQGPRHE